LTLGSFMAPVMKGYEDDDHAGVATVMGKEVAPKNA